MRPIDFYLKIYNFIASERLKNNDLDPRRIHSHLVTVLGTGLLMWAYAFLAFFTISSPVPGIVGFVCATIHLLSPLLFRVSANIFLICNVTIGSGIIHQGTFAFYTGGFESFILIWFGILPVLAGVIAGSRAAFYWFLATTTWAASYLVLHLNGFVFPDLIHTDGRLIAQSLIVFGWISLGTCMITVVSTMNDQKESKLAEQSTKIDDLFRVLFHDLAGPLSRLSIGLDIFKKDTSQANRDHGFEIAVKATDTMLEITQNVRKMYAVSKGKLDNELCYYSLNEAMEYVQRLYAFELKKKQIDIDYDFKQHHGLVIFVEAVSFKNQVLGNAISNAIKFSPPNSKIHVRAYPDDQYHVIEITDQGIGMPKTIVDSLFDITKKTTRPGTNGEMGTGFGMHILKSFMDMYQGKIHVESNDFGHQTPGTKLKLYLKGEWTQGGVNLPEKVTIS